MLNRRALADVLIQGRGDRSRRVVAEQLGVAQTRLYTWERTEEFLVLPPEELLPRISEVYGIDFDHLKNVWLETKEAQTKFTLAKRAARKKPSKRASRRTEELFSGGVDSKQNIIRSNKHLPSWRFGKG